MLLDLTTLEQTRALKEGRIDIGLGDYDTRTMGSLAASSARRSYRFVPRRVIPPLKLKHTAGVPLILYPNALYPNAPRPSYADQVLSFYRNRGLAPKVAFEVRQPWTALGLVAAEVGIALVPSSVRPLGRQDVEYLNLDGPEISSPIIMSFRTNDRSPLLAHILELIDALDQWNETKVASRKVYRTNFRLGQQSRRGFFRGPASGTAPCAQHSA